MAQWGLELEEASKGSRLPQALLQPEADTPGPERFLITAQEPNYLHVLGSGDSRPLFRHPPQHRLWSLHLHLPTFTYSLSALTSNEPLKTTSNEPLKTRASLSLTPKSPRHVTGGEIAAQRPVSWPPDSWSPHLRTGTPRTHGSEGKAEGAQLKGRTVLLPSVGRRVTNTLAPRDGL